MRQIISIITFCLLLVACATKKESRVGFSILPKYGNEIHLVDTSRIRDYALNQYIWSLDEVILNNDKIDKKSIEAIYIDSADFINKNQFSSKIDSALAELTWDGCGNNYISTVEIRDYDSSKLDSTIQVIKERIPWISHLIFTNCLNVDLGGILRKLKENNINDLVSLEFYLLDNISDSTRENATKKLFQSLDFGSGQIESELENLHLFGYLLNDSSNVPRIRLLSDMVNYGSRSEIKLANLKYLYLDNCCITSDIWNKYWPIYTQARPLYLLSLRGNKLHTLIPLDKSRIPYVNALDLSYNQLSQENLVECLTHLFSESSPVGSLRHLYLNNNSFKLHSLEQLINITQFPHNRIWKPMKYLDISSNTGITTDEIVSLSNQLIKFKMVEMVCCSEEYESDFKAREELLLEEIISQSSRLDISDTLNTLHRRIGEYFILFDSTASIYNEVASSLDSVDSQVSYKIIYPNYLAEDSSGQMQIVQHLNTLIQNIVIDTLINDSSRIQNVRDLIFEVIGSRNVDLTAKADLDSQMQQLNNLNSTLKTNADELKNYGQELQNLIEKMREEKEKMEIMLKGYNIRKKKIYN